MGHRVRVLVGLVAMAGTALAAPAAAGPGGPPSGAGDRAAEVSAYWDDARIAAAEPRDLVLDPDGMAWQRRADGTLVRHGTGEAGVPRLVATDAPGAPAPYAKPGGPADTTPPSVSGLDPAAGATIGATHTFAATVTDEGGVKSVQFVIHYPSGSTQAFAAARVGADLWSTTIAGFTDGAWGWHVVAKDTARRGGNTTTTPTSPFSVDTGGTPPPPPPPPGGDVVANAPWTAGGDVQTAAGRIYFEMPTNRSGKRWAGYVCSGTAVADGTGGRSVVLTAAHCVYDDVNKVFARNVLFIPDQDGTTGSGTDTNCNNDPLGCWAPDHGVVDVDWTTRTFPDNVAWDYGFYVVGDDAHAGNGAGGALDAVAGTLTMSVDAPAPGQVAHALGYSYSDDPNFMYCKEPLGELDAVNWWLDSCALKGGSSGGPWVQPMDAATGSGPVVSVNSWGYTTRDGMAGPKLSGSSVACLFQIATTTTLGSVAGRGVSGC